MIDTKLLRRKILDLAIRGKLVPQAPSDEPASELLKRINAEKAVLVKSGKIKKEKLLPPISKAEIPFDIPESWEWVRLGDIVSLLNGDRGRNYPAKSKLQQSGIPFVSALNLSGGEIVSDHLLFLSQAQFDNLRAGKFEPLDILLCIRGSLGKYALVKEGFGAIASSLVILRAYSHSLLKIELIRSWIESQLFEDEIRKYNNGTAQPNLAASDLGRFLFPLPPLEEQKRIVARVEAMMNEVDTIERETENLNRTFTLTREKALDLAIRGKLVPQDPNDEPASELLKRIQAEKVALIKSGKLKKEKPLPPITKDEIPFDIPASWSWVRLASLGTVVGGGTPSTSVPEYWDGAIPWLSPCDLSDYDGKYIGHGKRNISQEGLDHSSAALMPAGSILYSSRAPIGYVVIASNEISTNQGFKSLVPAIDGINEFIYYALKALTPDIKNRATGTTFKEISGSEFGKTLFPLPPLAEQKRIVEKLETILSTLSVQQ